MNEQGVMIVLDATRSRMQIKMWILFVKNMFAGSALAERFCCRTTNAFAFQSSLCSTSLYFRPPLAMIYVQDLVWRFSQKTWSTGISAGKHETLLIAHGCEWNVEESINLVGWHWNLNWRLQLNCKWIIAELKKGTSSWPCSLNVKFALHIVHKIYTRQHCYHKWALTLHKSLSLDELLFFLSKLDSLLVT
jgi:hypothetical protein